MVCLALGLTPQGTQTPPGPGPGWERKGGPLTWVWRGGHPSGPHTIPQGPQQRTGQTQPSVVQPSQGSRCGGWSQRQTGILLLWKKKNSLPVCWRQKMQKRKEKEARGAVAHHGRQTPGVQPPRTRAGSGRRGCLCRTSGCHPWKSGIPEKRSRCQRHPQKESKVKSDTHNLLALEPGGHRHGDGAAGWAQQTARGCDEEKEGRLVARVVIHKGD